jgi:hypothetical protein
MRYNLFRIVLFAGLWFNSFLALAQFDQDRFGKNRLQHQQFEWYFYTSNNFEVYYYDRGGPNAKMAIEYLEAEFDRLTQMIGYVAYTKPRIYIYNSPEELLQSNLGLNKEQFNEEGQTNFNRLIAEVSYKGQIDYLKQDLIYGTSKVIIEEMLYGSSVSDAFQSNLMNSFPEWYLDGIALYLAKGWSREMDDYIRHFFQEEEKPKILKLKEREAALVGQSIWNYIAEKYGRRYISSILNLSRINRNEENSIANTVGLNYKTFTEDWKNYYQAVNAQVKNNFKDVNRESAVAETSPRVIGMINDVKFSPDGLNLAYVINNGGRFKVQVRDVSTGEEQTVFAGGTSLDDQTPNFLAPVIAWRDSANIAIASFKRGTTTLRLRSIDGTTQDKIFLRNITQILSLDFNSTGKNMTLSAISNGKSDIYTLNTRGQGKRLTNDQFDDVSPMFLNDSTIIYSSNKIDMPDSLAGKPLDLKVYPDYLNLYMAVVTDSVLTTQLTNSNSKNLDARKINPNMIVYLSDLSGINNLMRLNIGNQVSNQISAYNKSIEAFDVNSRMNKIAYSVRDGRESFLIVESFSNSDQFTPSTPRVQLEQAKTLNERLATRRLMEDREARERVSVLKPTLPPVVEKSIVEIDTTSKNTTTSIDVKRLSFESKRGIDTENYTFDVLPPTTFAREPSQGQGNKINLLETFRKQSLQKRVTGPRQMEPQFFINNLNTRFVVDPLRGFGINLTGKMTDLLDNHSFHAGVMTSLDFSSGGDLFFEYEYLKSRIDFKGRFDRRTIKIEEGISFQKYILTKVEVGFSYPLTANSRVSISPFVAKTQYFNLNRDSLTLGTDPDQNRLDVNYIGGRAELVFDRTEQLGLYSQAGFKAKIGYAQFSSLNNSSRSFSNFYADIRNYQRIHKNIIFASRLYLGSFMGNNPQTYLVGGMDNWLFNDFYQPPSNRPEASPVRNPAGTENSNILFADFVDLRGYDYDEIRGRNVITFTSELRIPVFSYLTRGNITSNFIKNFQLVGFYDVGSAWNDFAPWEKVNDQNTEVINTEGSPFTITLNNFSNPWLQSYGAGLRTVLLNYYVKFDVARPVRNYDTEDLRFYVTLGFNF